MKFKARDFKVVYLSPTQHAVFELCERKWGYEVIEGRKGDSSGAQQEGTDGHTAAENWSQFGTVPPDTKMGKAFKAGIKHLPPPNPDLKVEQAFELTLANDIKLIGKIDLVVPPHLNGGVLKVMDHKFTKDLRYAMEPEKLATDSQSVIYAVAGMELYKVKKAQVEWVYYQKDGRGSRAVPYLHTVESLQQPWNHIVGQSNLMANYKRTLTEALPLTPNTASCAAYGGCEFADICPRPKSGIMSAHLRQFNKTHKATKELPSTSNNDTIPKQEKPTMPLPKRNAPKTTEPAPAPAAPAGGGLMNKLKSMKGAQGINPPAEETEENEAPPAEAPAAAPAPKAPRAAAPAPAPATKGAPFVVLVDCVPMKGREAKQLIDILGASMVSVAESVGMPHWNLAEFGKGPALLAVEFEKSVEASKPTGMVLVDSKSAEARAVWHVLTAYADVIIGART